MNRQFGGWTIFNVVCIFEWLLVVWLSLSIRRDVNWPASLGLILYMPIK